MATTPEPKQSQSTSSHTGEDFTPPRVPERKYVIPRASLSHFPKDTIQEGDTAWDFPDYLDNPNIPWLVELKKLYESPITFPASLSPQAGLLLHSLIRNIQPTRVVEVGTFLGVSTLWMAAAIQANRNGGIIHSFDDFGPIKKGPWRDEELPENRRGVVEQRLADAKLSDVVTLHEGISWDTIPAAHDQLRGDTSENDEQDGDGVGWGVQFAFLDGDHTKHGVWRDLWAVEPVLATGGYVLLHDTFPELCGDEGPRDLLDHVNRNAVGLYELCELYISPVNFGMGLLRRVG